MGNTALGGKKKLGRGLEALLGKTAETVEKHEILEIPTDDIEANAAQPRRNFRESVLADMAESIKKHGLLQPISVRKKGNGYELIAGEQRLRATKLAGFNTIRAIVLGVTAEEAAELALIENLQRADLNVIEEAKAYTVLLKERGCTQEELAKAIGKSRSYIANIMRLTAFPKSICKMLEEGSATVGQLRPLLALEDEDDMKEIAEMIVKENLSSREAEALVRKKKAAGKKPRAAKETESTIKAFEDTLRLSLGTTVRIEGGRGKTNRRGKICISFKNEDEFQRLIQILNRNA